MWTQNWLIQIKVILICLSLGLLIPSCSKDEQEVEEEINQEEGQEQEQLSAAEELADAEDEDEDQEDQEEDMDGEVAEEDAEENVDQEEVEDSDDEEEVVDAEENMEEDEEELTAEDSPDGDESVLPTTEPQVAAPPTVSEPLPTGRMVLYVRNSAKVYASASTTAEVVRSLEKGDHLLVSSDGSWAQLDNGQFVEAVLLSQAPVGRDRGDNGWQSQN